MNLYVDLHSARGGRVSEKAPAQRDGRKFSNQNRASRNPYPTQGSAPLSNEQKAALCIRAKDAFLHVHGRDPRAAVELTEWRRAEQFAATGKDSLTLCTQADYLSLLAHFANLGGQSGVAMNAHLRDATSDRRIALHKLKTELAARGLTLAWVATIARNKFKQAVEDCTAKQLWNLVFDIRNSKHKPTAKNGEDDNVPF
jgi:hypothetical protein